MRLDDRLPAFDYDTLWNDYPDNSCELVPLSQREISILVSCLRVAKWVARWFQGDSLLRDVGRLVDAQNAVEYIEQLEAKLLMTGCLEGLIAVMGEIRDALQAQVQCCVGGGGGGYTRFYDETDDTWYWGTEAPAAAPTIGEGGEFETQEDYEAQKCLAANNIASGLVVTFNSWSVLSVVSLSVAGGAVALFVANPPLAVMIALLVAGLAIPAFGAMGHWVDDNRETIVCWLYNSDSASEAIDTAPDWIAEMVSSLDLGALAAAINDLVMSMMPTDVINRAFTSVGLAEPYDAISCDSCDEQQNSVWHFYDDFPYSEDWSINESYSIGGSFDTTYGYKGYINSTATTAKIYIESTHPYSIDEIWVYADNFTHSGNMGVEILAYDEAEEVWEQVGFVAAGSDGDWTYVPLDPSVSDRRIMVGLELFQNWPTIIIARISLIDPG